MSLYHLNVTLHVLAGMLWLGGMFFLGVVGAPVLRRIEPPAWLARLNAQARPDPGVRRRKARSRRIVTECVKWRAGAREKPRSLPVRARMASRISM